jgi:hypothetical protein
MRRTLSVALKATQGARGTMARVETFVVRVFVPADADGLLFCGVVEHAGTGSAESFSKRATIRAMKTRRFQRVSHRGAEI